jgi:LDH2 family malate/lactate/ureidoglycolate dehydrogenase
VAVPAGDADLGAKILVDADLRGIDSHGVMNLGGYIQGLRAGTINPRPEITISVGSPTTASVDGDNGLGLVVSHRAMEECLRMAKVYGTGWATACHSNHSGAGAYYVLMAVEQGMIGIHSSSGGSTVAAPGGKGRLIGNNVLAFAAPGKTHGPFVLDMAPTMAIANKLHMLQWQGKKMPEGWAIDSEGRPITDRTSIRDGGPSSLWEARGQRCPQGIRAPAPFDILTGLLSGDGGMFGEDEHTHAFCALRINAFRPGRFTGPHGCHGRKASRHADGEGVGRL